MSDLVRLSHVFEQATPIRKAAVTAGAGLLLVALGWGAGAKIDSRLSALLGPSPEQIAARAAESAQQALGAERPIEQEFATLRAPCGGHEEQARAQAQRAHESKPPSPPAEKPLGGKGASAGFSARMEKLTVARTSSRSRPLSAGGAAAAHRPSWQMHAHRLHRQAPAHTSQAPPRPACPCHTSEATALTSKARPPPRFAPPRNPIAPMCCATSATAWPWSRARWHGGSRSGDRLPGGARSALRRRGRGRWVVMTDRGYIAADGRWDE